MESSERVFVWVLLAVFAGILVGTTYQNANQNKRLTVLETLGDVTDANKKYLAEFSKQVRGICANFFVSKDVYQKDLGKIRDRLTAFEQKVQSVPQRSVGTTAASQPTPAAASSASAGSAPQTSVSAPTVPTPNAAPIAGVPQSTVSQPSVAATNSAASQSPTGVALQASQQNNPATVAVTPQPSPQPSAVTAGNCDCNKLQGQLDQVNQKLDQIHERLGELPDKNWQTEENKRGSFLNAPPPPVESRPTTIPQRQLGPRVKKEQPVSLPNVNLAQPAQPRLHEEFLKQWVYNGTCYQKFVLKDEQGKTCGQPFSRPVGQQMAYRSW